MSSELGAPMVLQLAPLPRQQVGPYLILGVEKDATREAVEAAWAQRLIWARKGLTTFALEDINWAREMLATPENRVRSEATSLNLDTPDGSFAKLALKPLGKSDGVDELLDVETTFVGHAADAEAPDPSAVRAEIKLPELPQDFPAVRQIAEQIASKEIDPWDFDEKAE